MAHQILKTHDLSFVGRPQLYAGKQLFYGCKDILFSQYGEYWRQIRKTCALELLSNKKVKSFQAVREEEVGFMINQVSQSSLTSSAVDLRHMLTELANGIISMATLGKKRLKRAARTMDAFLDRVIKEYQERKVMDGRDGDDQRDFLDVLLNLQQGYETGLQMDSDSVRAIIVDMFNAGTETTATTIEWAMAELIKNPEVMKKAQEEVRRLMGRKGKVEENHLYQMHYLKCVIKETLRLHPVAPLLTPKESNAAVMLQGYFIPPKTRVIVNAWAIGRDPKSWERPEEFLPERFSNSPVDFKGQDFQFIPFGAGRRACPGISFAIPTMELALASLLYFFDWKMPNGMKQEDLDMSEAGGVIVCLRSPLLLIPVAHFF
ncbi:hypothetical protein AAC387_Pa12g1039 [Persea americana]